MKLTWFFCSPCRFAALKLFVTSFLSSVSGPLPQRFLNKKRSTYQIQCTNEKHHFSKTPSRFLFAHVRLHDPAEERRGIMGLFTQIFLAKISEFYPCLNLEFNTIYK